MRKRNNETYNQIFSINLKFVKGSTFTGSIVKAYFNSYLTLAQRTQLWILSHIGSQRSRSKSTPLNPYFLKICFIFEYEYFALYYMYE